MIVRKRRLSGCGLVGAAAAFFVLAMPARGAEKNGYQVNSFVGSFSTGIPISVPAFHGVEPRLSLSYSSEGRNGIVGVGWSLNGFSQITGKNEMVIGPGSGWPILLYLDGSQLMPCQSGSTYPSCASGGTHFTRSESYLKIVKVDENHWTVYGKDGTQTKFTALGPATNYSWKLGQSQTIDTHGNTVNYAWWNPDGGVANEYPSTATYNGYTIEFLYETRPDPMTAPVRYGEPRTINRRLKTI